MDCGPEATRRHLDIEVLEPERCKGTMYEHFVVVGVNSAEVGADETKMLKPEIVYAYPENTLDKVDQA